MFRAIRLLPGILSFALAALILAACTGKPVKMLTSILLSPSNASVGVGAKQQFSAMGTFSDGTKSDVTSSVTWTTSDATAATIDSFGLATALAAGRPKITATSGSVSATTTLISVAGPGAAAPRFAYVTNLGDNTLSIYAVDAGTGQLRDNGYAQVGAAPSSVGVDPSGKFAYVTNTGANDVSAFAIDSANGSLTPVAGSPFATGVAPFAVTMDPSGVFAYVSNIGASGNISAYTIDRTTGALTAVPGSPFASGSEPGTVAFDPKGNFAYVTSFGTGKIWVYRIDPNSGALAPVAGSPFGAGSEPENATIDPSGRFAYVINQNTNTVSAFTIDPGTGALTAMAGSPFPTGSQPFHFTLDPSGKFAFVANGFSNNVSAYTVNATTGAVVTSLPIGKRSDAAAYDSHTKRVFSSNGDGTLSVIQQESADQYKSLAEVLTQLGARTMTLDAKTGRIYLVTGDYTEVDPNAKDPRKRYAVKPGSARMLLLDAVP